MATPYKENTQYNEPTKIPTTKFPALSSGLKGGATGLKQGETSAKKTSPKSWLGTLGLKGGATGTTDDEFAVNAMPKYNIPYGRYRTPEQTVTSTDPISLNKFLAENGITNLSEYFMLPGESAGDMTEKYWTTPSDQAVIKTLPSGGQYIYDPTQPNKIVRTRRPDSYETRVEERAGLSSMNHQIDHIVPLSLGGIDSPLNKEILETTEHLGHKTKVQAVFKALLNAGDITPEQAIELSANWRDKDPTYIPELDKTTRNIDIDTARKIKSRWDAGKDALSYDKFSWDFISSRLKELPKIATRATKNYYKYGVLGGEAETESDVFFKELGKSALLMAPFADYVFPELLENRQSLKREGDLWGIDQANIANFTGTTMGFITAAHALRWFAGSLFSKLGLAAQRVGLTPTAEKATEKVLQKIVTNGKIPQAGNVLRTFGTQTVKGIPVASKITPGALDWAKTAEGLKQGAVFAALGQTHKTAEEHRLSTFAYDMLLGMFTANKSHKLQGYAGVGASTLFLDTAFGYGQDRVDWSSSIQNSFTMMLMHALGHGGNRSMFNLAMRDPQYKAMIESKAKTEKPKGRSFWDRFRYPEKGFIGGDVDLDMMQAAQRVVLKNMRTTSLNKAVEFRSQYLPASEKKATSVLTIDEANRLIEKKIRERAVEEGWSDSKLENERLMAYMSGRELYKNSLDDATREIADIEDLQSIAQKTFSQEKEFRTTRDEVQAIAENANEDIFTPPESSVKSLGRLKAGMVPLGGSGLKSDFKASNLDTMSKLVGDKGAPVVKITDPVSGQPGFLARVIIANEKEMAAILREVNASEAAKAGKPDATGKGKTSFSPIKHPENHMGVYFIYRTQDGQTRLLQLPPLARKTTIENINKGKGKDRVLDAENNKDKIASALKKAGKKFAFAEIVYIPETKQIGADGKPTQWAYANILESTLAGNNSKLAHAFLNIAKAKTAKEIASRVVALEKMALENAGETLGKDFEALNRKKKIGEKKTEEKIKIAETEISKALNKVVKKSKKKIQKPEEASKAIAKEVVERVDKKMKAPKAVETGEVDKTIKAKQKIEKPEVKKEKDFNDVMDEALVNARKSEKPEDKEFVEAVDSLVKGKSIKKIPVEYYDEVLEEAIQSKSPAAKEFVKQYKEMTKEEAKPTSFHELDIVIPKNVKLDKRAEREIDEAQAAVQKPTKTKEVEVVNIESSEKAIKPEREVVSEPVKTERRVSIKSLTNFDENGLLSWVAQHGKKAGLSEKLDGFSQDVLRQEALKISKKHGELGNIKAMEEFVETFKNKVKKSGIDQNELTKSGEVRLRHLYRMLTMREPRKVLYIKPDAENQGQAKGEVVDFSEQFVPAANEYAKEWNAKNSKKNIEVINFKTDSSLKNMESEEVRSHMIDNNIIPISAYDKTIGEYFGVTFNENFIKTKNKAKKASQLTAEDRSKYILKFYVDVLGLNKSQIDTKTIAKRIKQFFLPAGKNPKVGTTYRVISLPQKTLKEIGALTSNDSRFSKYYTKEGMVELLNRPVFDGKSFMTEKEVGEISNLMGETGKRSRLKGNVVMKTGNGVFMMKGDTGFVDDQLFNEIKDILAKANIKIDDRTIITFDDNIKLGKEFMKDLGHGVKSFEIPSESMRFKYHNPHKETKTFGLANILSKSSAADKSVGKKFAKLFKREIDKFNKFKEELEIPGGDANNFLELLKKYPEYKYSADDYIDGTYGRVNRALSNNADFLTLGRHYDKILEKIWKNHVMSGDWMKGDTLYLTPDFKSIKDPAMQGGRRYLKENEVIITAEKLNSLYGPDAYQRSKNGEEFFVTVVRYPTTRRDAIITAKVHVAEDHGIKRLGKDQIIPSYFDTYVRLEGDFDGDSVQIFKIGGNDGVPTELLKSINTEIKSDGFVMLDPVHKADKVDLIRNIKNFAENVDGISDRLLYGDKAINITAASNRIISSLKDNNISVVVKNRKGKETFEVYSGDNLLYKTTVENRNRDHVGRELVFRPSEDKLIGKKISQIIQEAIDSSGSRYLFDLMEKYKAKNLNGVLGRYILKANRQADAQDYANAFSAIGGRFGKGTVGLQSIYSTVNRNVSEQSGFSDIIRTTDKYNNITKNILDAGQKITPIQEVFIQSDGLKPLQYFKFFKGEKGIFKGMKYSQIQNKVDRYARLSFMKEFPKERYAKSTKKVNELEQYFLDLLEEVNSSRYEDEARKLRFEIPIKFEEKYKNTELTDAEKESLHWWLIADERANTYYDIEKVENDARKNIDIHDMLVVKLDNIFGDSPELAKAYYNYRKIAHKKLYGMKESVETGQGTGDKKIFSKLKQRSTHIQEKQTTKNIANQQAAPQQSNIPANKKVFSNLKERFLKTSPKTEEQKTPIKTEQPKPAQKTNIDFHTDGSDIKGTGKVGYGVYATVNGKEYRKSGILDQQKFKDFYKTEKNISNPTAELAGAIKALEIAAKIKNPGEINLTADYEGVKKWINGEYKAKETYIKHMVEVAQRLKKQIENNGGKVKIKWAKGHSGVIENEIVDAIAKDRREYDEFEALTKTVAESKKPLQSKKKRPSDTTAGSAAFSTVEKIAGLTMWSLMAYTIDKTKKEQYASGSPEGPEKSEELLKYMLDRSDELVKESQGKNIGKRTLAFTKEELGKSDVGFDPERTGLGLKETLTGSIDINGNKISTSEMSNFFVGFNAYKAGIPLIAVDAMGFTFSGLVGTGSAGMKSNLLPGEIKDWRLYKDGYNFAKEVGSEKVSLETLKEKLIQASKRRNEPFL